MTRPLYKIGKTSRKVNAVDYNYKSSDHFRTQANLAVTPAQMYKMAENGIPISAQTNAAIEGELRPTWDIPIDKIKHIDPAELWEARQTIGKKYRNAKCKPKNEE